MLKTFKQFLKALVNKIVIVLYLAGMFVLIILVGYMVGAWNFNWRL